MFISKSFASHLAKRNFSNSISRSLNTTSFKPDQSVQQSNLKFKTFSSNQEILDFYKMSYQTQEIGERNSLSWKMYYKNENGDYISPFHDIPFKNAEGTFNMVVEVPRWSNAKLEIDTGAALNPIKQDIKKGKLRYVANCFPYKGYIWNYGCIPQTWEDPTHKDANTQQLGDNDPVDVCEVGSKVHEIGAVIQIKVIGILAMIDEGETDWKVMVIDVTDENADKINNLEDLEKVKPGYLDATREWFKIYKKPDGKPFNIFAFDGEYKDKAFAENIINETHEFWKSAIGGTKDSKLSWKNTKQSGADTMISADEAKAVVDAEPAFAVGNAISDQKAYRWEYVDQSKE